MSLRIVSQEHWMRALVDSDCTVSIDPNYHGYMHGTKVWSVEDRILQSHILLLWIKGKFTVRVGQSTWQQDPNGFLWISPGVKHSIHSHSAEDIHLYARVDAQNGGERLRLEEDAIVLANALPLRLPFEQMLGETDLDLLHRDTAVRALLTLLSVGVFRHQVRQESAGTTLTLAQRQRLGLFVAKHIGEKLSSARLAAHLERSHDYFARVFCRTYGVAPRTWLMRERIRLASIRLVDSDKNIQTIARQFGYNNPYLFSRQFKQVMGVSPRVFRQRH